MPDRTKEEYKQIYNDFLEIQDLVNNKLCPKNPQYWKEPSYYNPINLFRGFDKLDKISDEFFRNVISNFQKSIDNDKVKTCEGIGYLKNGINESKSYILDEKYYTLNSTDEVKVKEGVSVAKFIKDLDRLSKGEQSLNLSKKEIEKILDEYKVKSGCIPIANNISSELENEAKELAYDAESISLIESNQCPSKTNCHTI